MKRPLPTQLYNQRASVYRNLHDQCLSVLHKQHVAGHASSVILESVRFRVQEGGRQAVLKSRRKNVHAFVDGTLMQCSDRVWGLESDEGIQVSYNPYKAGYFFNRANGEPVFEAKVAVVTPAGILAFV